MAPYHYITVTVDRSSPTNHTTTANGPISLHYIHCRPLKPNKPNTNFLWPHITTLESLSTAQAQPNKHQVLMAPYHYITITVVHSSLTNQTPTLMAPYNCTTFNVDRSNPTNQTPTANGPISLHSCHCRPLKPDNQTPIANGTITLHYSHCRELKHNHPNTNC
jgi:hypothetical protein